MSSIAKPTRVIEVFFSYAHEDERLRKGLEKQLSLLTLEGLISGWYDRKIVAGTAFSDQIDTHLNTAHIILLLISPDFMASEYCYGKEMMRAMERYEAGEANVIPIILRYVEWSKAPFSKLQALPKDGKPVTSWNSRDKAFFDIARGIRKAVEEIAAKAEAELAAQAAELEELAVQAAKEAELAAQAAKEAELAAQAAKEADMDAPTLLKAGPHPLSAETEMEKAAPARAEPATPEVALERLERRTAELVAEAEEATRTANQAAARAAQAQAELAAKRVEVESTARPKAAPTTTTDENKTPWEALLDLLKAGYSTTVLEVMENSAGKAVKLGVDFIDSMIFFEAFLEAREGAMAQAMQRLRARVDKLLTLVAMVNKEQQRPTPEIASRQELGLSKSILELLVSAQLLAHQSNREQANDVDMLEAFVLHGKSAAIQLLNKIQIAPELLLSGAFREDGTLNNARFSAAAQAVLADVFQRAQETRLVGSSHILAALASIEGSLARKVLWLQGHDPDRYVRHLLDDTRTLKKWQESTALNMSICSTRVRRILNLAELLARSEGVLVSEDYLFKAYWQCIEIAR